MNGRKWKKYLDHMEHKYSKLEVMVRHYDGHYSLHFLPCNYSNGSKESELYSEHSGFRTSICQKRYSDKKLLALGRLLDETKEEEIIEAYEEARVAKAITPKLVELLHKLREVVE